MTSTDRLGDIRIPSRRSGDDRLDLSTPRSLIAVHVLRRAGEGSLLNAARELDDSPFPLGSGGSSEVARRYGVSPDDLSVVRRAAQVITFHSLEPTTVAAFARVPHADGAVAIIAAAGLSPRETADLVQQRTRADLSALATLAALRGYVLPPADASGDPALYPDDPTSAAGVSW